MSFGTNKTPIEMIEKGAFVGTHFIDINGNGKWCRNGNR